MHINCQKALNWLNIKKETASLILELERINWAGKNRH